jgi:AH receptor-interacting protein
MLVSQNYYKAIECCTEVLKYDSKNLKAHFRRAKAHVGAWNSNDAEKDFNRCVELDPSLKNTVAKEIAALKEKVKQQDEKSKSNFRKMF